MNAFKVITARIIRQLEAGTVPWRKPWDGENHAPRNGASGRRYRGINTFLLSCSGFGSPHWLTYRQAEHLGGHVKKGEKSTPVVFWKWLEKRDEDPKTGERKQLPILRYYNVFNASQCTLPAGALPTIAVAEFPHQPVAAAEHVIRDMPQRPEIHHDPNGMAFYRPADDSVHMPAREQFHRPAGYYCTLFHELTHSTGHTSRLNRSGLTETAAFGSATYSREELIAEMGAAFLCGHTGIVAATIDNSSAYIAGWLRRLRGDSRLVVTAAAAAQKAADYVLDRQAVGREVAV